MSDAAQAAIFDNPFRARALRMTFRPGRLALMLMLHAAVLLPVLYAVNVMYAQSYKSGASAGAPPFGSVLLLVFALVEAFFITISVPFRAGMVLYSDRRHRCLDQLAACGLSPVTICWGHLSAVMGAASMHLLCALPYFGLCVLLGDTSVAAVASVYAVLWCYALVLACAGMALGALRGFAAPFGLILLMFIAVPFSVVPDRADMPSVVAALGPVRPILYAAFGELAWFARAYSNPLIAGVSVPCWIVSCVYYLAIAGLSYTYLMLGPDLRLAAGMNDFDAIITGRKKKRRRRLPRTTRGLLRKVQLTFLYENRPAGLKRWTCRLRELLLLVLVTVIFGVIAAIVLPSVGRNYRAEWNSPAVVLYEFYLSKPVNRPPSFGTEDELAAYMAIAVVWMAVLLPFTRRNSRSRIEHAVEHGLRTPADRPLLWQLLGLLVPFAMLAIGVWATGKPVSVMLLPHVLGLWLAAAGYSLAVGSLIAMWSTRAKTPRGQTQIAIAVIFFFGLAPLLWPLLYYFRLAPSWGCYTMYGSIFAAIPMCFMPWQTWSFTRVVVGAPLVWSPDWRWVLLLYGCAGPALTVWCSTVLRRFRKREEANRMARTRVDAGE